MSGSGPAPPLIRLCLDLNIWVADFLSARRGRRGGSSPWLADAARLGTSPAGPVQLVVSLGMLDRLALVLVRAFDVDPALADAATRAIGGLASLGPAGDHPYLLLGGGVHPIRDEEDRHVLGVALAGDADVLVTVNLADSEMDGIEKVGGGSRIRLYAPPGRRELFITHPGHVRDWLRGGLLPSAALVRQIAAPG